MSRRRPWWLPGFVTRHVLFAMVFAGLCGIGVMVFLIEFDHYTSTEAFCTSCHSMELAAVPYRKSSHFVSASGVRASCGDCHVSPGIFAATWDHFIGGKDVIRQLIGADYDDPVVNALHLPEAAFSAREWFRARDSATCRRCHEQDAIVGERAGTQAIHQEDAKGKTCVDCHINLVHRKVPERATFKRDAWNRMVETEFDLEAGAADRLLDE
ncbi:MAG: NapC/NirT family cytochrome c [Chromatiaceae bacterium]|nr:NapC/NirT family cytochrome c [Gammaproteobacteria bacterium]MCP5300586.1 NapC/NirT family cytochrome c [Chromatiaceae bacterium]MCP5422658.1 NapC/NirT family cytochrome c [Chromatiaceae bacterium]